MLGPGTDDWIFVYFDPDHFAESTWVLIDGLVFGPRLEKPAIAYAQQMAMVEDQDYRIANDHF